MVCDSSSTMTARERRPSSGPSMSLTPYASANELPLKSEVVTAFSIPSSPQKRLNANGRSSETKSRATSSLPAIFWLNAFSCMAQTPVSTLGNTLMITFLPLKSARVTVLRSVFTSVKSGAEVPIAGSDPAMFTGVPLNDV